MVLVLFCSFQSKRCIWISSTDLETSKYLFPYSRTFHKWSKEKLFNPFSQIDHKNRVFTMTASPQTLIVNQMATLSHLKHQTISWNFNKDYLKADLNRSIGNFSNHNTIFIMEHKGTCSVFANKDISLSWNISLSQFLFHLVSHQLNSYNLQRNYEIGSD